LFDELAAASKLMPLEGLVTLDKVPEGTDAADGLYSQSYVLFRYLFSKDAKKLGRFIESLGSGQAGQRDGSDFLGAFALHFGDPAKVQAALLGP
jgi:hypothetical protein